MEQSPPDTQQDIQDILPSVPRRRVMVPALALIAIGAALLFTAQDPPAPFTVLLLLAAGFGAAALARGLLNRREEAGLLFIGSFVTLSILAGVGARLLLVQPSLTTLWPLGLITLGLALRLAHPDTGMVALCCIAAGVVALAYTMALIPAEALAVVRDGWPVLLAAAGALLFVGAFYRKPAPEIEEAEDEGPPEDIDAGEG